jgi:hypothetical protein
MQFRRPAAILILSFCALDSYLLRGGFRQFEIAPYPVPPAAFTNWNDVLAHPRDISVTTFQTGVVHMDACLNLDPASPRQADCDHVPRDLEVLVHWVHHPSFGGFLIDTGFDDSFAKHPPYGNYTEAICARRRGPAGETGESVCKENGMPAFTQAALGSMNSVRSGPKMWSR